MKQSKEQQQRKQQREQQNKKLNINLSVCPNCKMTLRSNDWIGVDASDFRLGCRWCMIIKRTRTVHCLPITIDLDAKDIEEIQNMIATGLDIPKNLLFRKEYGNG